MHSSFRLHNWGSVEKKNVRLLVELTPVHISNPVHFLKGTKENGNLDVARGGLFVWDFSRILFVCAR